MESFLITTYFYSGAANSALKDGACAAIKGHTCEIWDFGGSGKSGGMVVARSDERTDFFFLAEPFLGDWCRVAFGGSQSVEVRLVPSPWPSIILRIHRLLLVCETRYQGITQFS